MSLEELAYGDAAPPEPAEPRPGSRSPSETETDTDSELDLDSLKEEALKEMVTMLTEQRRADAARCAALEREAKEAQSAFHANMAELEERCVGYCGQIDALSTHLEQVLERTFALEAAADGFRSRAETAEARVGELERDAENLRGLVNTYMAQEEADKQQRRQAQRAARPRGGFWDRLAADESLLDRSEPPRSYPPVKVHPKRSTEIFQLQARVKAGEAERKRLEGRVAELTDEVARAHDARHREASTLRDTVGKRERQLANALRRVKYLVQKQDEAQADVKRMGSYVARLEAKLLGRVSSGPAPDTAAAAPEPAPVAPSAPDAEARLSFAQAVQLAKTASAAPPSAQGIKTSDAMWLEDMLRRSALPGLSGGLSSGPVEAEAEASMPLDPPAPPEPPAPASPPAATSSVSAATTAEVLDRLVENEFGDPASPERGIEAQLQRSFASFYRSQPRAAE